MKYSEKFKNRLHCENQDEVFSFLIDTLKNKITGWDYFVNWAKVFDNIKEFEIDLNTLNYLIGKQNIEDEFKALIKSKPSIAQLVPVLIACRDKKFEILSEYDRISFKYKSFNFSRPNDMEAEKVVEFAKATGFLKFLQNKRIKSVVDYVIGVEVGLDSNGRKNRGGTAMENIVEFYLKDICQRNGYEYIKEATAPSIKRKWGLILETDKSTRRIDFVAKRNSQLYLIETNFYGGGGSKLKSTAGEYKAMYDFWKRGGHEFIWVTDGAGWRSTHRPLRETFEYTDYILNIEMVSKGLLEDIILGAE